MKNVCLLATDNNISKSYLEILGKENIVPSEIVFLKIERDNFLSKKYCKKRIKKWLNKTGLSAVFKNTDHLRLEAKIKSSIQHYCQNNSMFFPDYTKSFSSLVKKHGGHLRSLSVKNINDSHLADFLKKEIRSKYIIFCGGGILKKVMFDTGKTFIHIHPGLVPEIKGSDGILWSALVSNKIGISAFFMNEGIDTGDIITKDIYQLPDLNLAIEQQHLSYAAQKIVEYFDPVYRADCLKKLFKFHQDPSVWEINKQDPSAGKTYYFMHSLLKEFSAKKFLTN